jgi:hypothetical protein
MYAKVVWRAKNNFQTLIWPLCKLLLRIELQNYAIRRSAVYNLSTSRIFDDAATPHAASLVASDGH